jgi:hypothetical protein
MAQLLVFEGVERPEPVVGRAPSAPRSASTRSRRNHVVFSKVTGNGASPDPGIAPLPGAGSPPAPASHPGRQRPAHIVRHRGERHPGRSGHLAAAQVLAEGQPQDFTDLAHRHAGSGHRRHLSSDTERPRSVPGTSRLTRAATSHPSRQVYETPEPVYGFDRNPHPRPRVRISRRRARRRCHGNGNQIQPHTRVRSSASADAFRQ